MTPSGIELATFRLEKGEKLKKLVKKSASAARGSPGIPHEATRD
jgi:hypothetical protein